MSQALLCPDRPVSIAQNRASHVQNPAWSTLIASHARCVLHFIPQCIQPLYFYRHNYRQFHLFSSRAPGHRDPLFSRIADTSAHHAFSATLHALRLVFCVTHRWRRRRPCASLCACPSLSLIAPSSSVSPFLVSPNGGTAALPSQQAAFHACTHRSHISHLDVSRSPLSFSYFTRCSRAFPISKLPDERISGQAIFYASSITINCLRVSNW